MHPDPQQQAWQEQQRKEQKEQRKLEKLVREDVQNDGDKVACGNIVSFWGLFNAALLIIPLAGDHWWAKTFSASGVGRLYISTGLFNIEVDVECTESSLAPEEQLCNVYKEWANHESKAHMGGSAELALKGSWSIKDMKQTLCGEVEATADKSDRKGCDVLKALAADGWVPTYGLPVAASLEVFSAILSFGYWHALSVKCLRTTASFMQLGAGVLALCTFLLWFWLIPPIQQLPISWASLGGISDNVETGAYGLRGGGGAPFTWCTMLVLCAILMVFTRAMTSFAIPKHSEEPEDLSEDELWALQDAKAEAQWYGHYG